MAEELNLRGTSISLLSSLSPPSSSKEFNELAAASIASVTAASTSASPPLPPVAKLLRDLLMTVDHLDGSAVPIQVHHTPKRSPCVYSTEEKPLVGSIDSKVNVSIGGEIIVDESVGFCITLGQRFGPVARLAGQVRASILGKALDVNRVVGGETEPEDARPSDGELRESETDPLAHLHWSVAEDDPLAEAVPALGLAAVPEDLAVVAMTWRELEWRLI